MCEISRLSHESIRQILEKFDAPISDALADQVAEYIELLLRWNEKVNLTSIRDPLVIVERHFGEAIFGAASMGISSGKLLDVGSGAGFPALPIAMVRSKVTEVLLEPNTKKAAFLGEVCRVLGLSERVEIARCRLEEYSSDEKACFITSRAVRVDSQFLDRCIKLMRRDGRLILWTGCEDAKAVMRREGWEWRAPARIPGSEQRCILSGKLATS